MILLLLVSVASAQYLVEDYNKPCLKAQEIRTDIGAPRTIYRAPETVLQATRVVEQQPVYYTRRQQLPWNIKIIERHLPRYNVENKVAAPVYILPKHGPVLEQNTPLPPTSDVVYRPDVLYRRNCGKSVITA
ncbi:unnamed protein product [Enterobius vermicularis]|uniref:Conserved secreted protein n=1 Tax=Enterobius vermicularis TaxID=51028 RepID=A0A0N4VPZ5_ENTVE|nr:unnamed protein product [Enterobius vermicularis]